MAPDRPIVTACEVTAYPCIYLIDHHSVARRRFNGVPDEQVLTEAIETLVREAELETGAGAIE
jgi:hypothetical protein